mgnify:CR=1 FL=1
MKTCPKCQTVLPARSFVHDRVRKDKRHTYCFICKDAVKRKSYWAEPEKFRQRTQQWAKKNPAKKIASRKADYDKNRARYIAQATAWKRLNRARLLARRRTLYAQRKGPNPLA